MVPVKQGRLGSAIKNPTVNAGAVSFSVNDLQFVRFPNDHNGIVVQVPRAKDPVIIEVEGVSVLFDRSTGPNVTFELVDPAFEPARSILAKTRKKGLVPQGTLALLGPEGALKTPVAIKAPVGSPLVGAGGLYQVSSANAPQRLEGRFDRYEDGSIAGTLGHISSLIGVFNAIDAAAPRTELAFGGPTGSGPMGAVTIASYTPVCLTAQDQDSGNGAPSTGLATSIFPLGLDRTGVRAHT